MVTHVICDVFLYCAGAEETKKSFAESYQHTTNARLVGV